MSFPVAKHESILGRLFQFIPMLEEIAHFHNEESNKIKRLIDVISKFGTQLQPKSLIDIEIGCQKLCTKYGKNTETVAVPMKSDNHEDLIPINWKAGTSKQEDVITSSNEEDVKPFSKIDSRRGFDFWTSNQTTEDNSSDVKPSFSFSQLNPASGVPAYNIKKEEPVHPSLVGFPPSRSSGHPSSNNWSSNHSKPYRNHQQHRPSDSFKAGHQILPPPPPRGLSWDKGGAHSSSDHFRGTQSSASLPRYHPVEEKVFPSSSSSWKRTDTTFNSTSSTSSFSSQPPRQPRVPSNPAKIPETHHNGNPCRFSAPLPKSVPSHRNSAYLNPTLKNNAQESSSSLNYECLNPPSLFCDAVDEVDGPSSSPSIPSLPPKEPSPTYNKPSAPYPSSKKRRSPSNAQLQCSTVSQSTPDRPHDHDSTREPVDKYTSPLDSLYNSSGSKLQTGRGYGSQSSNRRTSFVRSNSCSSVPPACGSTDPSSSTTHNGSSSTVKKTPPAASHLMSDESEDDLTSETVPFKVKEVRKKLDVSTPVFVPLGRNHPRGFINAPQEDQAISGDPEDDVETSDPEPSVDPVPTVVDLESPSCAPKRRKGVVKKAAIPYSSNTPPTTIENPDSSDIERGTVSRNETARSSRPDPASEPSFSSDNLEPPVKKKRGRPRKDESDSARNTSSQQRSTSNGRIPEKRQPENTTTRRPKQARLVPKELENLYEGIKDYMKDGPILNGTRRTRGKSSCSKEQHNGNESSSQDDDCLTAATSSERVNSNTAVSSIHNSVSPCESRRSQERDTQVDRTEDPSTTYNHYQAGAGETQVGQIMHPIPNQDEKIDLFGTQLYLCGNTGCDVKTETPRDLEDHLMICDLARDSPTLVCKHCFSAWKQVAGFMVHLKQHGTRRYSCGICNTYRSAQAQKIRAHIKEDHGVTRNIVEVVIGKGPGTDYPGNNMYTLRPRDK